MCDQAATAVQNFTPIGEAPAEKCVTVHTKKYKVGLLFGIVCIDSDALFTVRNQPHLRCHNHNVVKPRFVSSVRRGFFSTRVINMWNNLPADTLSLIHI